MPDRIKNTIGGSGSRAERAAERQRERLAENISAFQAKVGWTPEEVFDPGTEGLRAKEVYRELVRDLRAFARKRRLYLEKAVPSAEFAASWDVTNNLILGGIASSQAVASRRAAARGGSRGGLGRGEFRGLSPQRQLLAITEKRMAAQKDIRNIETTVEALSGQEVKIDTSRLESLKAQVKTYEDQAKAVKEVIANEKKLNQTVQQGHVLSGARAGMRLGTPFGAMGKILGAGVGAGMGGVFGAGGMIGNIPFGQAINFAKVLPSVLNRQGLRNAAAQGQNPSYGVLYGGRSAISAAWRLAGMRGAAGAGTGGEGDEGDGAGSIAGGGVMAALLGPGTEAAYLAAHLASAGYGLAKTGWAFQAKGGLTALSLGLGNKAGMEHFQNAGGIGFGFGKYGEGWAGPTGAVLNSLGIGPNEGADLMATYGARGFNMEALAGAVHGQYLAGVGAAGLSQAGRWGTRALGMDNPKMFAALKDAVAAGVNSGMTGPEVEQTFVSISRAMAVGTGAGMTNVGLFNAMNAARGNIAAFNTPEGMIAAAGAMANAGASSAGSPFGFALMNAALQDRPGRTYEEKLRGLSGFKDVWRGLTPKERGMFRDVPNWLDTQAIMQGNLLGPLAARLEAGKLQKMVPGSYAAQFLGLKQFVGADAARFLLNPEITRAKTDAHVANIDDTTKAIYDVFKSLTVGEATTLIGAAKLNDLGATTAASAYAKALMEGGSPPSTPIPSHGGSVHWGWDPRIGAYGFVHDTPIGGSSKAKSSHPSSSPSH